MTDFLWYMFLIFLLVCLFGFLNVLIPTKLFGIRTRRRALLVAVVSLALASAFSHLWHYSLPPEEKARIAAESAASEGAREERSTQPQTLEAPKAYASGTLVAMAEGSTGWIGIGGIRTGGVAGITFPALGSFGYAVEIDNIMYIGKCTSLFHTKKTLRDFIVGDSVRTRLDGDHLYIVANNGKEIRLRVVQRQRM